MELACTFNICWSNYIFYPSFLYGLHFTTRYIMTGQVIFTIIFIGRSPYLIKKRYNLLQLKEDENNNFNCDSKFSFISL